MASESKERVELLQGTLDLIVLRALHTTGAQHAYGLAARLEQIAQPSLTLNQGTLYPALVRLEQKGWIKGAPSAMLKTQPQKPSWLDSHARSRRTKNRRSIGLRASATAA
jgi:hypothetical protein